MSGAVSKSGLFASLPPVWVEELRPQIRTALASRPAHKLVVLDDDPTGTQTVHDVPVLTTWDVATLKREFSTPGPCFFLLTNSRSLPPVHAENLSGELARNLSAASGENTFTLVSRSDSTLRGHFPLETDVLERELGPFDATLLIPYFEAGGRYTINDIHYVAAGDLLVPAAETPFAQDPAFGYRNSNLRAYVAEKTAGRVRADDVATVSLSDVRRGGPEGVHRCLLALPAGGFCIVNAAAPADLEVFVAGLFRAELLGKRYLFRTAAQFVAARLGLEPMPLWQPGFKPGLGSAHGKLGTTPPGGLVIVGSYVSKTTEQLAFLAESRAIVILTLKVESLLNDAQRGPAIDDAVVRLESACRRGEDIVLATSRELVTGATPALSLDIGNRVSSALVEILRRLGVRPRYLIAKGGITASDLATGGLGVKRALVLGQLLPGVPVWELGPETKFPGLAYVVFPGNVGEPESLLDAVSRLRTTHSPR